MRIVVNGIEVSVTKKTIKNMHLYVKPPDGHVEVSAPVNLSDESIELFIRTKIGWIQRQQEKFDKQPRQTAREYVSGEALYVWGRQYYLLVNYSNKGNSLILDGDKAILTVRESSTTEQREKFLNEWYRGLLKACQRRLEIVRKRRRNFVILWWGSGNKIKRFLAEKGC